MEECYFFFYFDSQTPFLFNWILLQHNYWSIVSDLLKRDKIEKKKDQSKKIWRKKEIICKFA